MGKSIIKYVDTRPIYFPALANYPRGIELNQGDTLKVTDKELKYFLRQKNGKNNCYIEEKMKKPSQDEIKVETVEVEK